MYSNSKLSSMISLSVAIITFNEEKNIERCLQSVLPVADEIVVVDSFSTDKTEEICAKYSVRFIKNPFAGHIQQKNFAKDQCSNTHVLSLDADEALSEELTKTIIELKKNWKHDGYTFNRATYYCGKFIRHCGWYPGVSLRLWDKTKGNWGGDNPHDKFIMNPETKVSHISGDLLHYSFYTIEEHVLQSHKFSTISALSKFKKGRTTSLFEIWFAPKFRFIKDFIFKLGFLDGFYGYMVCKINSHDTFLKYSKLYDLHKKNATHK